MNNLTEFFCFYTFETEIAYIIVISFVTQNIERFKKQKIAKLFKNEKDYYTRFISCHG